MKNQLTLTTLLLTGGLAYAQTMGTMTNSRDGKTYETVTIGNQEWMAENLDFIMEGSYVNENGDRLYTWEAAMKACPPGWYLPSDNDWEILVNRFGGKDKAGVALKSTSGWHLPSDSEWSRLIELIGSKDTVGNIMKSTKGWVENGNGTNSSGFNAVPAGFRYSDGTFSYIGIYGHFWSSTEKDGSYAWNRFLYYVNSLVFRDYYYKGNAFSCRCLRD